MNQRRIIITGGAGFIGSHLAESFVADGDEVIVVDDLSAGSKNNLPKSAEFIKADLQEGVPDELFSKPVDIVFHLAAQINVRESWTDPASDARTNIVGSLQLLQKIAQEKVGRLITFSSGGAVYDPTAELSFTETSPIDPQTPYGLAKYTLEEYHHLLADKLPEYTILRPSNVYGPRQGWGSGEAGVIAIFIEQLLAGDPLTVYSDGQQTRDFVHVDDVVAAANAVCREGLSGVFNVSTGQETTIKAVAEKLIDFAGSGKITYQDGSVDEVDRSCLSADKIATQSGWSPQTDITAGLEKTFRFEKHHAD